LESRVSEVAAAGGHGPATPPRASLGALLATVLIGGWTVLVAAALPALAWVVEQLLLVEEVSRPAWLWPVAGWAATVLAGGPAYLLARLARAPAIRVVGHTWAAAALLLGVLGTARAVPTQWNEAYLALYALLAFGVARLVAGRRRSRSPGNAAAWGVVAGLASLLPWLVLGALGGLLETGLALAAAAATGWLAAVLLERSWPPIARGRARRILLGGLVAGVALVPLAAATGGSGANLLAILALPPLCFVAAALPARGAVTAVLGLAASGPLAFVEPTQTTILLGLADVGFWAVLAALTALCVAVLLAIGYGLGLRHPVRRPVAGALVAILAAGDLAGYLALGHPGLYGDRLFVLLKARADLTGVAAIGDLHARRTEAYRRLVDTANRSQRPLRHELSLLHLHYTSYYLVNGLEVDGGPAVRAWLSRRSDVDRVLRSPRLRPVPQEAAPLAAGTARPGGSPQWNIRLIGADRVWATGDTGAGIVIGTSDSGVDGAHPALAASFRGGDDSWYDPWNGTRSPTDHSGHGTHTLGTAIGRFGIGIAPGARWMGCVNLDRNLGNPAHYLDCLQYMLAPFRYGGDPFADGRPDRAADVLTNSWGCSSLEGCDRGTLRPAVDALTAAGIFVVAAAGNAGPRCGSISDPPAPYPDTVTVGAVDRAGRLASFSSRGPVPGASKPDLVAPGTGILSAVPGGGYRTLDGTSMAAPHVAGVVALMWVANPALVGDVPGTAALLRRTATRGTGGCPGDGGAGLVDAYAAVQAARAQ
jgi:subtilisin family serine protease